MWSADKSNGKPIGNLTENLYFMFLFIYFAGSSSSFMYVNWHHLYFLLDLKLNSEIFFFQPCWTWDSMKEMQFNFIYLSWNILFKCFVQWWIPQDTVQAFLAAYRLGGVLWYFDPLFIDKQDIIHHWVTQADSILSKLTFANRRL